MHGYIPYAANPKIHQGQLSLANHGQSLKATLIAPSRPRVRGGLNAAGLKVWRDEGGRRYDSLKCMARQQLRVLAFPPPLIWR